MRKTFYLNFGELQHLNINCPLFIFKYAHGSKAYSYTNQAKRT